MKLKEIIDKCIQKGLRLNKIDFAVDSNNRLLIEEVRVDKKAKAGMLYLVPETTLPKDALPSVVIEAKWVYSVFYHENKAVIIEVSTEALDGEIIDYYSEED
ncbi:MAG: hypothetical protein GY714_05140 [Desulfobacterales bacterium]|nr:hypothetical protein [Desulfobacterales bacterium]